MKTKTCSKCSNTLAVSMFYKNKTMKDGLMSTCKTCDNLRRRERALANPEYENARSKAWRKANPEAAAAIRKKSKDNYRANHYDKYIAGRRKYYNAKSAKRRAAKLKATGPWTIASEIAKFYKATRALEYVTGIKYHVDHIVPLRGEGVCGLHTHSNMQILRATDNIAKSNHYSIS